jgi:hypothetical protein
VRHVARIIGLATMQSTRVPWEDIHSKASMRGTKSNLTDEVALRNEEYVTPLPRHVSQHPSPPPALIDQREPPPIASPCIKCKANQIPCQRRADWSACVPCHAKRERCSLTPITRALKQAARNRAILDDADIVDRMAIDKKLLNKVQEDITTLNAAQESVSRRMNDIVDEMEQLREVINTWLTDKEHNIMPRFVPSEKCVRADQT